MKLHGINLSPYVARVALACEYKGLEFEPVRAFADMIKTPEHLAISPMGKIPAFTDGDVALSESNAIIEYLEDAYPENPLLPDDAAAKAKIRMVAAFVDNYIQGPTIELAPHLSRKHRDETFVKGRMTLISRGLSSIENVMNLGSFAMGDKPTIADCMLVPAITYLYYMYNFFGIEEPLADHLTLKAYWDTVMKEEHASAMHQSILDEFVAFIERTKA